MILGAASAERRDLFIDLAKGIRSSVSSGMSDFDGFDVAPDGAVR